MKQENGRWLQGTAAAEAAGGCGCKRMDGGGQNCRRWLRLATAGDGCGWKVAAGGCGGKVRWSSGFGMRRRPAESAEAESAACRSGFVGMRWDGEGQRRSVSGVGVIDSGEMARWRGVRKPWRFGEM